MHVVDALASRWGVETTTEGKTVWADLGPDRGVQSLNLPVGAPPLRPRPAPVPAPPCPPTVPSLTAAGARPRVAPRRGRRARPPSGEGGEAWRMFVTIAVCVLVVLLITGFAAMVTH